MKVYLFPHHNKTSGFELKKEYFEKIEAVSKEVKVVADFREAEILIVPNLKKPVEFSEVKNLKWVHLTSAGVGNIPKELMGPDVLITNSSGVHPIPIAEQVFSYMLMFARDLPKIYQAQMKKEWIKDGAEVFELSEKTVLIVGLGKIGRMIAQLCKAFRMRVLGVVEKERKEPHVDRVVSQRNINSVLPEADFVINCLPGTQETLKFFDHKKFGKFKKGAYFINIGRGSTVDEKVLVEVLKKGKLAGAGLDVFFEEPLKKSSPLWSMNKVIIPPHIAGNTPYYMDRVIEIFIENLRAYLASNNLPNLVDKKRGY